MRLRMNPFKLRAVTQRAHPDPGRAQRAAGSVAPAAARRRVYADLARLVVPQGFFWERDFARRNDGRRPGVDNLAAAVR
ncbi:MAG: hypothetical protein ACK4V1_11235, partial [Burkholderiaceae bacterium]